MRLLLVLLAAGSFPHSLVGSWTVDAVTPGTNTLSRWTFAVYADGRYDFSIGSHTLVFDDGAAAVKGTRVTLTERVAKGERCAGAARVGIYTWRLSGRSLTLTPLTDRCAWRRAILTAHPLSR